MNVFFTSRRFDILLLLVLAITARLWIGLAFPSMVFFDEIYQILEPAHFKAFGTGFLPWEFYLGVRSWLIPMLFAPMMQAAAWFSNDPDMIQLPIKFFLAAISAITPLVAYGFGRRFYGRGVGLALGIVLSLWSEQMYFATHPLNEIIITPFILWALFIADRCLTAAKTQEPPHLSHYVTIGVLFGLGFILRFHLTPAMLVVALWLAWAGARDYFWQRTLALIAGGLTLLVAAALFDWLTLGTPLQSVWLNAVVNLQDGISSGFGTSPPWDIFDLIWRYWILVTPIMVWLVWLGWRRSPLLLVFALVILLTHTIIAHKEQRFIFPAITIFTLLAGFGLVELYHKYSLRNSQLIRQKRQFATIVAAGVVLSLSVSLLVNFSGKTSLWLNGSLFNRLFHRISTKPHPPCAFALDPNIAFYMSPAQSGLSPSITLYTPENFASLLNHASAYDGILSDGAAEMKGLADRGYRQEFCVATRPTRDRVIKAIPPPNPMCFYQRSGSCEASHDLVHLDGLINLVRPERWRYGQRDLLIKLGIALPKGMEPPAP